jgi:hypothetical protein
MHMKVATEQFEIRDNRIVHTPTGAIFYKGDGDQLIQGDWGTAGTPLPSGHDYSREQVMEAAQELLVLTRARPVG